MNKIIKSAWLIFSQFTTILFSIFLVVSTLKPQWIENIDNFLSKNPNKPISPSLIISDDNYKNFSHESHQHNLYQSNFRNAAKNAMPAVVHIFTSQTKNNSNQKLLNDHFFQKFFGENFELYNPEYTPEYGLGSGVIVTKFGHIITNHHVIDTADTIEVSLSDGRKKKAKVIGKDPDTDLAILKISDDSELPAIIFGKTSSLFVGDPVIAIGNPFGIGQTVTKGIISALGRNHFNINTFENFIQTDAAINPGNSGGALVDINGKLIGINSAIYSQNGGNIGIGFAIPSDTAKMVLNSIIKSGKVKRGYIGIQPAKLRKIILEKLEIKNISGTYIKKLILNGPADKAGLKLGDIILRINGVKVQNTQKFFSLVATLIPGTEVLVEVIRNKESLTLPVVIEERPSF